MNERNEKFISYRGQRKTVREWSKKTSIPYGSIQARLHAGWSVAKTFETPYRPDNKRMVKPAIDHVRKDEGFWVAYKVVAGKEVYIGSFQTEDEARRAASKFATDF